MSVVSGINSYVIEGESGKRLYDQLRSAMEKCQSFDKKYDLGEFMGKHYAIRKEIAKDKDNDLPNYILYVFEGKECIAGSCFDKECVKKTKGALHITEEWYEISGGFETYVTDSELYLEPGFYFESYNSDDMAGYTNDAEGKYFQKSVVYYGVRLPELEKERADGKISEKEYIRRYKKEEAEVMKGYNKLSPAEQLDFCMERMDKIIFSVTEIIDSALWFAHYIEE